MGEIITFNKTKEEELDSAWECECGCNLFYLLCSGWVICSECEAPVENLTVRGDEDAI